MKFKSLTEHARRSRFERLDFASGETASTAAAEFCEGATIVSDDANAEKGFAPCNREQSERSTRLIRGGTAGLDFPEVTGGMSGTNTGHEPRSM